MAQNDVCAILTVFRPDGEVLENLAAIRPQVQYLVIVDNGSPLESLGPVLEAADTLDIHVIRNPSNLGLATALNIGSRWAIGKGCRFLLYFDQDSTATPGMVSALLQAYDASACSKPVGMVATTNRERHSDSWQAPLHDSSGMPVVLMTSGSLLPASVFADCGPFEDDFFIEFIDHEYCLRLRSRGYQLVLCPTAELIHDVGFPRLHSFFGLVECRCTHHRPERRYYFTRNLLVLLLRYWKKEPAWSKVEILSFLKSLVKITMFEEHRMVKLWMALRGAFDGIRHAMGQRVRL